MYLLNKCTTVFNSFAELSAHLLVFSLKLCMAGSDFIALFTSEACCSEMQTQVVDVGKQVQMPKGDEQYAQELSDIRGKIQVRPSYSNDRITMTTMLTIEKQQ